MSDTPAIWHAEKSRALACETRSRTITLLKKRRGGKLILLPVEGNVSTEATRSAVEILSQRPHGTIFFSRLFVISAKALALGTFGVDLCSHIFCSDKPLHPSPPINNRNLLAMAPRSEFIALDNSGLVEFKPRIGTWASYDAWSQPRLQEEGEPSFDDDSSKSKSLQQPQQRRRVRFACSNDTQEYMHKTEYTSEEKRACWYKRADYQAMRAHNAETVEKMAYRIPLDEDDECHFGLEYRTPNENHHCHQIMRSAILAVLDEQDDQWRFDGCLNDDFIAARYSFCTWEARDRALSVGQQQSLQGVF